MNTFEMTNPAYLHHLQLNWEKNRVSQIRDCHRNPGTLNYLIANNTEMSAKCQSIFIQAVVDQAEWDTREDIWCHPGRQWQKAQAGSPFSSLPLQTNSSHAEVPIVKSHFAELPFKIPHVTVLTKPSICPNLLLHIGEAPHVHFSKDIRELCPFPLLCSNKEIIILDHANSKPAVQSPLLTLLIQPWTQDQHLGAGHEAVRGVVHQLTKTRGWPAKPLELIAPEQAAFVALNYWQYPSPLQTICFPPFPVLERPLLLSHVCATLDQMLLCWPISLSLNPTIQHT